MNDDSVPVSFPCGHSRNVHPSCLLLRAVVLAKGCVIPNHAPIATKPTLMGNCRLQLLPTISVRYGPTFGLSRGYGDCCMASGGSVCVLSLSDVGTTCRHVGPWAVVFHF